MRFRRPRCEHAFVSTRATILHADLDAFYASVEQRDDPRLRGKPVIVGGGVVLAASYEAKARGVRTAMGGHTARSLCPDAIVVPARMSAYSEASRAVFRVFRDTSPAVEALSIDEAFIEARGLERIAGTPEQIARRLRRRVLQEVGLPITVGVARTKFLAKVASGVAKPDGLLVVDPERELEFLHSLEVERLWGVGPATSRKLRARGLTNVGEVARVPEAALVEIVGRAAGRQLHALAHNRDPRRVRPRRRRRSMGAQRALGRRRRSREEIDATLLALTDRLARRLRGADRVCRTVTLRMRFDDFSRATRSHTLLAATAETPALIAAVNDLHEAARTTIEQRGLTLIGVTLGNLENRDSPQLVLPVEGARAGAIDSTVDLVRDRFGSAAITRGSLVGRDPGIEVPLLPDCDPPLRSG
jgi:DNA polymerase-4